MQTLVPTAVRLNNLSGSAADLDDSPDSPDASWCTGSVSEPLYAIEFPSNVSGTSNSSDYGVIQFANPDDNGLPITGPSNAGITVIRRVKPVQQTGYYAQFWYVPVAGAPINGEAYWGFHPYPSGGTSGTTHYWEIATDGGDVTASVAGPAIEVTKGDWYLQALRVEHNGGSPIITFWTDLPSTANADKIVFSGDFGNVQTDYRIVIGNSPWMAGYQEERASCHHGQIKIIAKALSEADIVSEAGNMASLVTTDGQNSIWWGKNGFTSVDDLTCDYGTGRSFSRVDTGNILALGDAL